MELGQPSNLKRDAAGGGLTRLRLNEGTNIHRVLFGPLRIRMVYYPSLQEDRDTGEQIQRMKLLRCPIGGSTPLDVLSSLEKRIRRERGEKEPRSSLDPTTRWVYLIIDKQGDNYPAVEVAEYPYTVYDKLINLEAAISLKDANKLRYGLVFMWDAIITKNIDKTKPLQYGTSYTVEVDPDNPYANKVPKSYLGMSMEELNKYLKDFSRFFSTEEWEAVEESTLDIQEEGQPDTPEQMEEKLSQFPIFLGATNPDGSYRFPSIEQFKTQLDNMGMDYYLKDLEAIPQSRRLEEESKENEEEFGEEMEVEEETFKEAEEAEFEEVEGDEEEFEEEPKKEQEEELEETEEELEEAKEDPPKQKRTTSSKRKPKTQKSSKKKAEDEEEDQERPTW